MHRSIYADQPSAQAVVHAHSTYATALSCTSLKQIPPFHYMMALVGGNTIEITPYKLFGTRDLAEEMRKAMREPKRRACLLGNHGQVCYSEHGVKKALALAVEVGFSLSGGKLFPGERYLGGRTGIVLWT